jgi:hypothetical protein
MNECNQTHPDMAELCTELIARLRALDRQRVDGDGRIHEAEVAVLAATKALHAVKARIAGLLEQKRVHEHAGAGGEAMQLEALLVAAADDERACDASRRQALLRAAHLKLELEAARCHECITGTIAEAFQAFVDEAERFAQVYQATERRPLTGFDAAAIAVRALNGQANAIAEQYAPKLASNVQAAAEASSVVAAVEELRSRAYHG